MNNGPSHYKDDIFITATSTTKTDDNDDPTATTSSQRSTQTRSIGLLPSSLVRRSLAITVILLVLVFCNHNPGRDNLHSGSWWKNQNHGLRTKLRSFRNKSTPATGINLDGTETLGHQQATNNTTTTAKSSSSSPTALPASLLPRLELLHIQKNAGSLLEVLAMQNGIPWGICHFSFPWKESTVFKDCPPLLTETVIVDNDNDATRPTRTKTLMSRDEYWHYPLQKLYNDRNSIYYSHQRQSVATKDIGGNPNPVRTIDPYDNHLNDSYVSRPKVFFVVVRNPYDRVISMFHYRNRFNESVQHTRDTNNTSKNTSSARYLNEWVQESIRHAAPNNGGLNWPDSTICQYQYLYFDDDDDGTQGDGKSIDNNGTTMMTTSQKSLQQLRRVPGVEHIVQFENLTEDFNRLANQYNLPDGLRITPNHGKENAHNYTKETLDVVDLTTETLKLLNEKCHYDFQLLSASSGSIPGRGYDMVWTQEDMIELNNRRRTPKWLI